MTTLETNLEKRGTSIEEINSAVASLRTVADNAVSKSEVKERFDNIEGVVNKFMDSVKADRDELAAEKEKGSILTGRLDQLEKILTAKSLEGGVSNAEQEKSKKLFDLYTRKGDKAMSSDPEILKALQTNIDPDGGYLVPEELASFIIKKIVEISPIRTLATVIRASNGNLHIPKRNDLVTSYWVGECQPLTPSNSTLELESLKVHKLGVEIQATEEMLGDSAFDLINFMQTNAAESMAQLEGAAFVNGDGVSKPEGFMFNPLVPEINSGTSGQITGDGIVKMQGELKSGYSSNAIYGFNRRSMAEIFTLKASTSGNYIFNLNSGFEKGFTGTVHGRPWVEIPDMPDPGVDTYPIIYGDFRRAYTILDGTQVSFTRDEFTQKRYGKVVFIWFMRTGGQVTLEEALVKLKLAS